MTHPQNRPSPTPREGRHRRTNWLTQPSVYHLIDKLRPVTMRERLIPRTITSHAEPDDV